MIVNKPSGTSRKDLLRRGKSKLNQKTIKPIRKPKPNEVPVFLKKKSAR
jgi:hypothetical protein